jgi:formamidopyrimidine-DNA glycosylase
VPELPEVETIRRRLAPAVEGRRLDALVVHDPRWCLPLAPGELADAVEGRTVRRLGRRGKYLIWELDGDVFLLVHLRMTGTLLYDAAPGQPYRRVTFGLDDAHEVAFCDPRRFGTGELAVGRAGLDAFLAPRLGLEPLEPGALTGPALRALARGVRAPIKAFLLDQRRIAGVGNIYADEALFRAQVHPLRPAGSLRPAQYAALAEAVVQALRAGLTRAGRPSTTSATRTASPAPSSTSSWCTCAAASRAGPAGRRSSSSWPPAAGRTSASGVRPARGSGGGQQLLQPARAIGRKGLGEPADDLVADDDLGERHHPRPLHERLPAARDRARG